MPLTRTVMCRPRAADGHFVPLARLEILLHRLGPGPHDPFPPTDLVKPAGVASRIDVGLHPDQFVARPLDAKIQPAVASHRLKLQPHDEVAVLLFRVKIPVTLLRRVAGAADHLAGDLPSAIANRLPAGQQFAVEERSERSVFGEAREQARR